MCLVVHLLVYYMYKYILRSVGTALELSFYRWDELI